MIRTYYPLVSQQNRRNSTPLCFWFLWGSPCRVKVQHFQDTQGIWDIGISIKIQCPLYSIQISTTCQGENGLIQHKGGQLNSWEAWDLRNSCFMLLSWSTDWCLTTPSCCSFCLLFSKENGHLLLICSSLSTISSKISHTYPRIPPRCPPVTKKETPKQKLLVMTVPGYLPGVCFWKIIELSICLRISRKGIYSWVLYSLLPSE